MQSNSKPRAITTPVIIAVVLLLVGAVAFFVLLLTSMQPNAEAGIPTAQAADYADTVARLMSIGDASRAETLSVMYICAACHRNSAQIAPQWSDLLSVAPERRPGLTAEEYIYESIVHPGMYLVEGYPASMPQDYGTSLSEQDLADILVYLVNGGT